MKAENTVDEIEPAVSSALGERERTAIRKCFKEKALLCSICEVAFKHLVEQNTLEVKEDLIGEVFFVLADLLYNVQRD